jgi:hypothetical protein
MVVYALNLLLTLAYQCYTRNSAITICLVLSQIFLGF